MIKQVTIWTLQDKCFGPNLNEIKKNINSTIESLPGKIPGLISAEVNENCLSSSNGDIVLECIFEDDLNFKNHNNNELWNDAMNKVVIPFVADVKHVEFVI